MSDVAHQGCTWWFDFTKSLDPRCLTVAKVPYVSSKSKRRVGFPLLSSCCQDPTQTTKDRRGGYTQVSHVLNWKHTHTKKSIVWNFADTSYRAARLASTCVLFVARKCCTMLQNGLYWKSRGGESPGTSHGKQSHFFEFRFDLMNSNVLLDCCSSQLLVFFQLTAKGGASYPPPLFFVFFFFLIAVAHWWLPLGPVCMCPKFYQYIKKKMLFCESSKYCFLHPCDCQELTQSWVLSKLFNWILYVAFLFFCWQVHKLWIIAAMVWKLSH